ncbi:aspartate aminotransferase family protein [Fructilactobacillus myrtifloralis]|uniref:Aspartate aminotransferase family protein n=1 Tax=Fructilactobacillus myrtifloralis TaxID=2940301 RepID=A0ABY5BR75_9LACO|nr:aspartate aminotransferase family protein [Fructilactobacillus myrtifloralis]USS85750.1 aspartate aminotransferase family protein [Fructilactobacillus myrtifloralis]
MSQNQALLHQESQGLAPASRIKFFNVVLKSGKGAILTDADNRDYIDLLSSASSTNTGHAHPHVVHAIQEQATRLIQYTPAYFATEPEIELVKRLTALAPIAGPVKVAFGNSGSDANDAIIKFARAYTGRQNVVSFTGAYHGSTYGSITTSAVSLNMARKIGPLLPGVVKVPFPSHWDRLPNETEAEFCDRMFAAFKQPFETYLPADETALVEIEAIQGDGGFCKAPARYLDQVYTFCQEHGILFAVDEVNQGLGRSGTMWSIDHFPNVHPDLIAVGKSIASGLPLSAVLGRAEVMDALAAPGNVYTTAGNPVTTAAANATLDVINDEHLVERSARLGKTARQFFLDLRKQYPFIGDVRIYGLNGGIDVVDPETKQPDAIAASMLITRLLELGVLMITVRGNVLRFQPPLVIPEQTLQQAFQIIETACADLQAGRIAKPDHQIGW